MSRARPENIDWHATRAAARYEEGGGCLSGFILIPLAVVLISALLGSFAWKTNASTSSPVVVDSPPVTATGISPIFRAEVHHWAASISRWSAAAGVDPNLAATVMQIESCGDPRATSSAGAMGLFQVMPFHFRTLENPYDPDTNAARGLGYLQRSLSAGGGDNHAIGTGRLQRWNWRHLPW